MRKQFHLIIFSNKLDEAISFEHLTFQTSILNASVLLCVPVCAHLLCVLAVNASYCSCVSAFTKTLAVRIDVARQWTQETGRQWKQQLRWALRSFFLISSLPYFNIVLSSLGCIEEKRKTQMKLTDSLPCANGNKFHVTLLSRRRWAYSSQWPQAISIVPPAIHHTQSL